MEQGLPTAAAFSRNAKVGPLRVGYVSGDFVRHAVSRFVEPIFERHDGAQFEITCYHNRAKGDAVTERLRAYAGRWRNVAALDDAALAAQIREDGIHILVDLSGHTAGNRLGAFALRCAPVQATITGIRRLRGFRAWITDSRMRWPIRRARRTATTWKSWYGCAAACGATGRRYPRSPGDGGPSPQSPSAR